jgi:hypothetical protein
MSGTQSKIVGGIVAGALAKIPQGFILFIASEMEVLYVNSNTAVRIPGLSAIYWAKHVIWGAVFGLLFSLPVLSRWPQWARGLLIVGFGHAAGTLFVVNPIFDTSDIGFMGLGIGPGFPIIVLVFDLIWGLFAGIGLDLWNLSHRKDGRAAAASKS